MDSLNYGYMHGSIDNIEGGLEKGIDKKVGIRVGKTFFKFWKTTMYM